jgi:uncharacterized phage protein (TIGR02218 family)
MAPNPRPQNLKVSSFFIEWILQTNRGIMGHLYKFTSNTGINDYFTDLDIDINYGNILWKSSTLRFEGLQRKLAIGLNVDEQTLKIWASPTDTLYGANFLSGVQEGLLDGSTIVRYRAIWRFVTGNAAADIQQQPLAVWPLFTGFTSTVPKGGTSHIEVKVKSALLKLNVNMPRNYFQPGCNWTLFDAGCTLIKADFAVLGTIGVDSTLTFLPLVGGVPNPVGADGIANYAQGRLLFTSGVNMGLQVLIDFNNTEGILLAYTLDSQPSTGDTVTYFPGCSKSENTCDKKFNNKNNYRGFDKVPPIMVSM